MTEKEEKITAKFLDMNDWLSAIKLLPKFDIKIYDKRIDDGVKKPYYIFIIEFNPKNHWL